MTNNEWRQWLKIDKVTSDEDGNGVLLDQLEKAVGSIWNSDGAMKKIDAFMMANGWRVNGYRRENPHSTNPQDGTGYAKYTRKKKGTGSFYKVFFLISP